MFATKERDDFKRLISDLVLQYGFVIYPAGSSVVRLR
jgi:hypothetical protein